MIIFPRSGPARMTGSSGANFVPLGPVRNTVDRRGETVGARVDSVRACVRSEREAGERQ